MGKVSTSIYLKRLGRALKKLLLKSMVIACILGILSFGGTYLTDYSYISILRFGGFGLMLIGAFSKMGGHSLNNDGLYRLGMTSTKMKNKSQFEQDTLMSNNSFLLTCVTSGGLTFAFSIVLAHYILI